MTVETLELSPELCTEWDAYVATKPNATAHHLSAWMTIAERAYHLRARLVVARDDGAIRGILPLVSVPRPLGHYLTTGLFGAYGPVLADHPEIADELLAAARRITDTDDARYLHVKALGEGSTPRGFTRRDLWVTAKLPLDGGPGRVWSSFRCSIRAAVRQALRAGLTMRTGHDQLDAFYDVLAENMHRKGSPIYGRRFMSALLEAFGARAPVVTLWRDGMPISGAITLAHGGVAYVPFASSRAAYFRLRPNNLLYWRIIERACEAGLGVLDFGTSLRGASCLAFKLGWGAVTEPVPSYLYVRSRAAPAIAPDSRAVGAGVALWKILPRPVADVLGPEICRVMV
jgi:FemAB-related protein (PEP-CTERM system-associated)